MQINIQRIEEYKTVPPCIIVQPHCKTDSLNIQIFLTY